MKRLPILLVTVFTLAALTTACDDYAEGPSMSFRSKSSRVVNTWVVEYALVNGEDRTYRYDSTTMDILEDGTFEFTSFVDGDSLVQEGLWDLIEDDTQIRLLYTDPAIFPDRAFWEIIRLKEKELWVKEDQDSVVYELRLMPK